MKIVDVFESINSTTKFIVDRTKKIKQYLNDFDALVNANGYETTETAIINFLDSIPRFTRQILTYYATTDSNFKQHLHTYNILEKQLRDKVNSGISYE
jgi:hypothetical protein